MTRRLKEERRKRNNSKSQDDLRVYPLMWILGTMKTRYRITKETLKTLIQGTGGEIYSLEKKIYKRRKTRTGRYYMEGHMITSVIMTKEYAEKIGFIQRDSKH